MTVGIVVVSHSRLIADGVVELCAPVAPGVAVVAAGGTADGGLGTSTDAVLAAAQRADGGDGVALLGDLGSAMLTAETVVELAEADHGGRWRVVDAPLVEGAVAAAVAAAGGADLDEVVARATGGTAQTGADEPVADAAPTAPGETASVVLTNADGLHARPAAALVRLAARFDAGLRVNGADARSLLQVLALGLGQGATVEVSASGPDAAAAVDAVRALVESGFGEG